MYCAYWGRGYACNPAAIHAKARELAPHLRSVFLVEPDAVDSMPPDVEYAVIGSRQYWEVLARAKYLVNNANFADAVVKRPGSVHLQTQHGTPLKKMGADQATYPVVAAATGSFARLLARVDRWDYNLTSNRHSTEMWEKAFPGAHETLEYGYPRNDVYCTATAEDVARVRKRARRPRWQEGDPLRAHAPRLLHRLRVRPGSGGVLRGDRRRVRGAAARPLLLRPGAPRRGGGRIIDVTGHRSSEDVCLAADALITDYSSIMFDYANLDRPIVVYADDWDVYRETRGVYFDLMRSPARPGRPYARGTGGRLPRRLVTRTSPPRPCAPRSGSASASSTTAGPPSASYAGCCWGSRPRRSRP